MSSRRCLWQGAPLILQPRALKLKTRKINNKRDTRQSPQRDKTNLTAHQYFEKVLVRKGGCIFARRLRRQAAKDVRVGIVQTGQTRQRRSLLVHPTALHSRNQVQQVLF